MADLQIIKALPPMFDEIDRAFDVRGKQVVYCFGSAIYNPAGITIGPELQAHEKVHSARQGNEVLAWWRRYIDDVEFRLNEEIPAHQAEYRMACAVIQDRNRRAVTAHLIASRLAGPLYGRIITAAKAKELLRQAA